MRHLVVVASFCLLGQTCVAQSPPALTASPQGWVDLFPDASLKGWTRIPIPAVSGLQDRMQWQVDSANKVLICKGDGGHEWLRYDKELGDFIFHVEWRFIPREGNPRYNSGIGIRLSKQGEIWHQAQTGAAQTFLFGDTLVNGAIQRINLRDQVKDSRVKPPGEWNVYEVRCQGALISLWVNGATVCEFPSCQLRRGYIGLEAEGYEIHFRNLRLKELP